MQVFKEELFQFAAAKAGLVLVNINPAYQPNELKYALNKVNINPAYQPSEIKYSLNIVYQPCLSTQ